MIMSKLFGSVNKIDYHNKFKQSYLALDKKFLGYPVRLDIFMNYIFYLNELN